MSEEISWRWGPRSPRVDAAEIVTSPIRHGVIDGVIVDFRHSQIDAKEWAPRAWWHFASDSIGSARLSFPSDNELSVPALKSAIAVQDGDTISLGDVEVERVGPSFLHPHDRDVLVAELRITRPNGEALIAPNPLRLYGVTELRGPPHDAFGRMVARATSQLKLRDINDFKLPHFVARRDGLASEATAFLKRADSSMSQLRREWREIERRDDREALLEMWGANWWQEGLYDVLNSAALGGYLLARSEAEALERGRAKQDDALASGRLALKDYDGRRVRAREIWTVHPKYTLNRVATLIAQELGKDKASIMASIKSEVPQTSPSYPKVSSQ